MMLEGPKPLLEDYHEDFVRLQAFDHEEEFEGEHNDDIFLIEGACEKCDFAWQGVLKINDTNFHGQNDLCKHVIILMFETLKT